MVSLIATVRAVGFTRAAVTTWPGSWALSWAIAFPTLLVVLPVVRRMVAWLDAKDACFRFAVQPQTDPATQPVEDPTIIWDEAKAPFIDVATIRIRHRPARRASSAGLGSKKLTYSSFPMAPPHAVGDAPDCQLPVPPQDSGSHAWMAP